MIRLLLVFVSVFALISCSENDSMTQSEIFHESETTVENPDEGLEGSALSTLRNEPLLEAEDTTIEIYFDEFTITIGRLFVYDPEGELEYVREEDELFIDAELGETIEGQRITLEAEKLTDIQIEQAYETSVSISYDGPHCDLYNWKHYVSDWEVLKQEADGSYTGLTYTPEEAELFPEVSVDDMWEAAANECGEGYRERTADIHSVHEYPASVGISNYFLRISGKSLKTGETITKIIRINIPMGC